MIRIAVKVSMIVNWLLCHIPVKVLSQVHGSSALC